jgi:hypothetical protein
MAVLPLGIYVIHRVSRVGVCVSGSGGREPRSAFGPCYWRQISRGAVRPSSPPGSRVAGNELGGGAPRGSARPKAILPSKAARALMHQRPADDHQCDKSRDQRQRGPVPETNLPRPFTVMAAMFTT